MYTYKYTCDHLIRMKPGRAAMCTYKHMHTHIHMHIQTHTHTHAHTHVHVHMNTHMHTSCMILMDLTEPERAAMCSAMLPKGDSTPGSALWSMSSFTHSGWSLLHASMSAVIPNLSGLLTNSDLFCSSAWASSVIHICYTYKNRKCVRERVWMGHVLMYTRTLRTTITNG
jgi:hypothetical protein